MKKIYFIVLIFFFVTLLSGEDFNVNNRGLSVLEINTSPISASLPTGYSVFGKTVTSFLDNPAILVRTNGINMVFNHEELGFDIRRDDIFFSKKLFDKMGLMMGIGYYNGGAIELRDIIPQDIPTSTSSFSDFIAGAAIGYEVYNELKIGVGAKFISQYSYIYSGMALSFDAGVLFKPFILKGVIISLVFNNFGPSMNFGESQNVSQPTRVKFAFGREFDLNNFNSKIGVTIGGYSKYYVIPYSDTTYTVTENIKNFFNSIPDRAVTDIDVNYLFSNRLNVRGSYLLGGENSIANVGIGLIISRFRFDYSYTIEKATSGTHRIGIEVNY